MDTHKSIVIIEDEQGLLKVLRDEFTTAGFNVHMAKDGKEGLEVVTQHKPDIILADILMPGMDGITMLQNIRQNPELSAIPAILLTNLNDAETIQKALENGAYDYVVKSDWNPKDLIKRVKEKLGLGE